MSKTEAKLWKNIWRIAKEFPEHKYTRVETRTVDGISDVEYHAQPWHGWIELKTAIFPKAGRPFRLQSAYTLAQCSWQVSHHRPAENMRSWVLIGILGIKTWAGYVLVPAPLSTHLIQSRKGCPHEKLLAFPGVLWAKDLRSVLSYVAGEFYVV